MKAAPQRIVHVVYRLAVGGLENGVVNLVNHLSTDEWRHTIVALTDVDPAFAGRIRAPDVELVALGKGPGQTLKLYPRLIRLFRQWSPAIVHTRNLAALEVAPAARLAGIAARVHGEHGRDAADPDGSNARRRRIRRLYRPFVSRYVAVAPDLARYLTEAIGVPPGRIDCIPNGVDTARFRPAEARQPIAGCPFGAGDRLVIGTVGRLDPVKDQANLARAFALLLARRPELRDRLRLVIAGEGPERARIEAVLADGGVQGLAWLAGERADVADLMRGLDVFVLPSLAEGMSNTILEAMASGLPVIATAVGANADLVEAGVTGRVIPPGDPVPLAAAIEACVDDGAATAAQGRAGRRRAVAHFSLVNMVERYQALYRELAVGRQARHGQAATHPTH
jgi:sugar transferase (PEP-CTERM/EpsH1 system associated)